MPDVRYELAEPPGPRFSRLLDAWRDCYSNGDVLVVRLRAVGVEPDAWFRTGANLFRNQSFQDLFDNPVTRRAMRRLRLPDPWPVAAPPEFFPSATGTLTLDGELAHVLVAGGAYRRHPGPAAATKAMAAEAVGELIGDRHEDCEVHGNGIAWTPWFTDLMWDHTFVLVDRGTTTVTVICATDAD